MKKFLLLFMSLLIVLLSFTSCGKKNNKPEETMGGQKTTAIEEPSTEPLPQKVEYSDYVAINNFSDGFAFVKYRNGEYDDYKYGYIDKTGKICIELPEGYNHGFAFKDGLALIGYSYKMMGGAGGEGIDNFAVINKKGEFVISNSDGKYVHISSPSEGIICAGRVDKSYKGTEYYTDFLDYEGNVIKTINETYIAHGFDADYFDHTPNLQLYGAYFENGCVTFHKDFFEYDYYNKSGELVSPPEEENIILSYGKKGDTIVIENRTKKTEKEIYVDGFKRFGCRDLVGENRIIIELENDYYTIIDTDGNLMFEPVIGEIWYLGENLYYLSGSGEIIDEKKGVKGKIESSFIDFVFQERFEYNYFSEGMMVTDNSLFLSDKGEILPYVYEEIEQQ